MLLENVEVMFVNRDKPDNFGKIGFAAVVSEEQAAELESHGLTVKKLEDGKLIHRFNKNPVSKKGEKNTIDFYDRYGEEFEGHIPNGTHCDVSFRTFEWSAAGRSGVASWFIGAKILDDLMDSTGLSFDKEPVVTDDSPF